MSEDEQDTVGYMKPPKHSRWKKGQSGYPSGRPKGKKSPSLETALTKALMDHVVVSDKSGKTRRITKLEAAATQLANKAASGNVPSIKLLATFLKTFSNFQNTTSAVPESDSVEAIRARIKLDVMAERMKAAYAAKGLPSPLDVLNEFESKQG